MALTESTMLPLGQVAPFFSLLDVISGNTVTLEEVKSDIATVIVFSCNHCPYVKHIQEGFVQLVGDYQSKGISFVVINSNDVASYPDDSPEKMKEVAIQFNYTFPYLFDETQEIAKAYRAACTPDFYIFDRNLCCVYRGQLDGSRPGNGVPVTGESIRLALDCILSNSPVMTEQQPSSGCNIKWR